MNFIHLASVTVVTMAVEPALALVMSAHDAVTMPGKEKPLHHDGEGGRLFFTCCLQVALFGALFNGWRFPNRLFIGPASMGVIVTSPAWRDRASKHRRRPPPLRRQAYPAPAWKARP